MTYYQKYHGSFRQLRVWQQAHNLAIMIYRITSHFPDEEKFGMVSQLRRAASSVSANIAEGSARNTRKDQNYFYTVAKASLTEVDNFLELAHDLQFLTDLSYKELLEQLNKTGYLLQRLIASNKTHQTYKT